MGSETQKDRGLPVIKRLSVSVLAGGVCAAFLAMPAMAAPADCDTELSRAKAAVESAELEVAQSQVALDSALEAQAAINDAIGPVADELDAAKQQAAIARGAADEAADAKKSADEALSAAQAVEASAQDGFEQAEVDREDAAKALEEAQIGLSNAQAAAESALAAKAKGAAGYFEYRGQTDAARVLTDGDVTKYISDIHLGGTNDATSLDNMILALQQIKTGNGIRASVSLAPWTVSDTLMAVAMANTDRAAVVWGHPQQFGGVAENLATGYSDPFAGWYYKEKEIFDNAVASGDYPGLASMSAWEIYTKYPALYNSVGHYLNVIGTDSYTGFGATGPSGVMGQVMASGTSVSTYNGESLGLGRILSVSEYIADVQSYKAEIDADIAARDQAQVAVTEAERALSAADATLSSATSSLSEAKAAVQAAQTEQASAALKLQEAERLAAEAEQALAEAQDAYDNVPQELRDAKEAADEAVVAAHEKLGQAQHRLDEAKDLYAELQKTCAPTGGESGSGNESGSGSGNGGASGGSSGATNNGSGSNSGSGKGNLAETGATIGAALLAGFATLGGGALLRRKTKQ